MTYIPKVTLDDGPQLDAFGRLRVSNTDQRLDVEFNYNKQEEFFDEISNNGSVTHNANTRDLTLALADANNGSYAGMASHPVPCTPGNSQLIDMTGVLNLADLSGGTIEVFLRSSITGSAVTQVIEQDDWINTVSDVDWSLSHIFQIDFQSLKVGRIRYGMVRDGAPVCVAEITNDNLRNSGYWQLPSLPAYWKLYTSGGITYAEIGYGNDDNAVGFRFQVAANASATMKAICVTVKSEGGGRLSEMPGLPRSADRDQTPITIGATLVPIISIRAKSTFQGFDNLILSIPKSYSMTTNNPVRVVVVHDAVLTGAAWNDVDTSESSLEFDVAATSFTNGHEIHSDYITTDAKNRGNSGQGILGKTVLWNRQGVESGIFTLAAVSTTATNASCLASLQWEEIR